MKTNEQKAKESRIKLGNKCLGIFRRVCATGLDTVPNWTVKCDGNFSSRPANFQAWNEKEGLYFMYSESETQDKKIVRLELHIKGERVFYFCLADLDGWDSMNDYSEHKDFFQGIEKWGIRENNKKKEEFFLKQFVDYEKKLTELNITFEGRNL